MPEILKPLNRSFYLRDTLSVARELIGKKIIRNIRGREIHAMIVETEAYIGAHDPASHSFGRITERNKIMYGPAGYSYVYIIYGNHYCFNTVTGDVGEGNAVLIRAAEIKTGIDLACENRKRNCQLHDIANGPAKLCMALCIDKTLNAHDLTIKSCLYIAEWEDFSEPDIVSTLRIGISKGKELPYRFILNGSPFITKHKNNTIIHKSNN